MRGRPLILAALVLLLGALYLWMGWRLAAVGGTLYYVLAAVGLLVSAALLAIRNVGGIHLLTLVWGLSLLWAFGEVGADLWALQPRLSILTGLTLWAWWPRVQRMCGWDSAGWLPMAVVLVVVGVLVFGAFIESRWQVAPLVERAGGVTPKQPSGSWPHYGNANEGTRFVRVGEITPANVAELKEVWRYRTGHSGGFKSTPIQVGELLYTCAAYNVIIALSAETGEKVWEFDPDVQAPRFGFAQNCRGVTYHKAADEYEGQCPERIITATTDARLFAVNALTGEQCTDFGEAGVVNLLPGMGEVKPGFYFVTSPVTIARGRAIIGGWVADNQEVGEPSGVVRAFDVLTGDFAWAWDMGRPGVHTEPQPGEHYTRGTPNVWSMTSYDDELGLIYAPVGNATPDYFGAHRSEAAEKYASSVVALDVETGALRWSFQTVHHDIWDYDVPAQPVLLDLPQGDGSVVPAVLVATKRSELFLLDRRNGDLLSAVEERSVPQQPAEGEWLAPTQPFSVGLPNFRTPDLSVQRTWGITPWDHIHCRIAFHQLRYDGHFTPPTVSGSLQYPGNAGGFNWGGVSVHEDLQLMVGNSLNMAMQVNLIPREEVSENDRQQQRGTPYAVKTRYFFSPLFVPCMAPPYSQLMVVDLQTRELLWQRSIGTTRKSGPFGTSIGINLPMGVPLLAGTIVTEGGLIFVGGTQDGYFRALDLMNGEELWRSDLPGVPQGTPMSYQTPQSGKQRVIVQVPADGRLISSDEGGDPEGGYVIAYGLDAP